MSSTIQQQIRSGLELLFKPGDAFEVRVPNCRERAHARYASTCSGYFTYDAIEPATEQIAKLDHAAVAPGVYVTLNPVAPALLARSLNRIKAHARATTQDRDIVCRRWLLVDVDPIRPVGVSSTEAELALARQRAEALREYLDEQGWPAPVVCLSGNGIHMLYRIDAPSDDAGLVKRVLEALAQRFDDGGVAIDRTVHNPARIVKLIGTVARKGDELRGVAGLEDRPHRRAALIARPESIDPVPAALLEAVASQAASGPRPASAPATQRRASTRGTQRLECTAAGVRAWLEDRGVAVKGERRNGDKTLLLLERCPINPDIASIGESDIAVLVADDGKLAYCNKHNRGLDYTWHDLRRALEPGWQPRNGAAGVDLSEFQVRTPTPEGNPSQRLSDPGPLPEEQLRVPGLVSEVMDHSLATAPYPNVVMAFCGALSLQAFLAGRKVRDAGDNRTNIYLLGLAHSAAGKDWPRKLNTQIVHQVALSDGLAERFASGEGIQDALFVTPTMLFQTDEVDAILQSINRAGDARHEHIMSTLLTMYSSANSVYPMRRKAEQPSPGVIEQPCLVLFGTAIPNHYYAALSERMLTNGFFARMIILESGPRGTGQEARAVPVPPRVLATARWWADFQPGRGNLDRWHPVPAIVEMTAAARAAFVAMRTQADEEYARAEAGNDAVSTTVWGRAHEHARKLALLYAISENHQSPRIDVPAAQWASQLVLQLTRRMLYMAQGHVADNPFHAECLKLKHKLLDARDRRLLHSVLLKRMKMDAKRFRELIDTLVQAGEVIVESVETAGRTGLAYRLLEGETSVNEGERSPSAG
jgi:hypothetical protein